MRNMFSARESILGPMDESQIEYAIYIQGASDNSSLDEGFGSDYVTGKLYRYSDQSLLADQEIEGSDAERLLKNLMIEGRALGFDITSDNTAVYTPSGKDRRSCTDNLKTFPLIFE